jgi:ABC-type dipeptide/oligopeptide/nickel transport system ATPase component
MIVGIVGEIGSGKSHYQIKHGLELCNRKHKRLVTNFKVHKQPAIKYCLARKMYWAAQMLESDQYAVLNCKNQEDVLRLLSCPASVVCLDEAGIFFNSRAFKDTPKDLLMDLAQSRKTGTDLLWAAQFDSQVDKQFRMLTQYYVFCQGYSVWSKQLVNHAFKWKSYHHFKASQYEEFDANPKLKNSFIKTVWFAFKNEVGPLSKLDRHLFDCYESFSRLDKQETNVREMRTAYRDEEYWANYRKIQTAKLQFRRKSQMWREAIKQNPFYALSLSPKELKQLYK